MSGLSLGQKAIVLAVLGPLTLLGVVVFFTTGLLGKTVAVLVIGTGLSAAFKVFTR